MVGDGDDIETGSPLGMVEDGRDGGRPVGGEGVDVKIGATEAIGHRSASRSGQIGIEGAPPLGRCIDDVRLELAGLSGEDRLDALATRAVRRDRHLLDARGVAADAGPPDGDGEDGRAGLEGDEGCAGGQRGRVPEERCRDAAAGEVAVGDDGEDTAGPGCREELAASLAQADEADAHRAPRLEVPAGELRVADRLHRPRRGPPGHLAGVVGRQLDGAEVHADEHDRAARLDRRHRTAAPDMSTRSRM